MFGSTTPLPYTAFDSAVTLNSVSFDAAEQWSITLYENDDCTCPFTVKSIYDCPNQVFGQNGDTICTSSTQYLSFTVDHESGSC